MIETSAGALRELCLVVEMLRDLECGGDMIVAQLLVFARRKQASNLQDILDLATVEIHLCKRIELLLCDSVLL